MGCNGEDMIGMSIEDQCDQDVRRLCECIMGTAWGCLTEREWKEIESLAFQIGHYPQILNASCPYEKKG